MFWSFKKVCSVPPLGVGLKGHQKGSRRQWLPFDPNPCFFPREVCGAGAGRGAEERVAEPAAGRLGLGGGAVDGPGLRAGQRGPPLGRSGRPMRSYHLTWRFCTFGVGHPRGR